MENYRKYRWFFTSSGKLVVGGKNAEQNDELLRDIKKGNKELTVMHTSHPGSPFSIIISEKATEKDKDECAVFTGCFSRAWKDGKKETEIHIFSSKDLYKVKGMKSGTWGVKGDIKREKVKLSLVLAVQERILRAVPEKSVKKSEVLLKISPGDKDKTQMAVALMEKLKGKFKLDEILSALPAGGVKIIK